MKPVCLSLFVSGKVFLQRWFIMYNVINQSPTELDEQLSMQLQEDGLNSKRHKSVITSSDVSEALKYF